MFVKSFQTIRRYIPEHDTSKNMSKFKRKYRTEEIGFCFDMDPSYKKEHNFYVSFILSMTRTVFSLTRNKDTQSIFMKKV
jgi:hypothetical protein